MEKRLSRHLLPRAASLGPWGRVQDRPGPAAQAASCSRRPRVEIRSEVPGSAERRGPREDHAGAPPTSGEAPWHPGLQVAGQSGA